MSVGGLNTGKPNAVQVQLAFLKLSERELKYSHQLGKSFGRRRLKRKDIILLSFPV